MKTKTKIFIVVIAVILMLVVLVFGLYSVDKYRASNNKSPIFCIKVQTANDDGSEVYLGIGYKVIKYKNILDGNEVYDIGNWSLEFKNPYVNAIEMEAPLPIIYSYFSNPKEGVALFAGDQAMGTYALKAYSTIDGGINWKLETENYDGFIAVSINASYLFISNKIGFISNPSRSGEKATLLVTTDGGKTFKYADLVDDSILETFDNGNKLRKNDVYDYYELPIFKDGTLTLVISQGSDGDYKGGKRVLEYQSNNMGRTWSFINDYIRE